MGLFDIDYENLVFNLTPQTRRQPRFIAWLKALLVPQKWKTNAFFNIYATGSDAPQWSGYPTEYTTDDLVMVDKQIWQCIVDESVDQYPPTHPDQWQLVASDFRGVNERVCYNSQKLVLEYVLNHWFGTMWLQPDSMTSPTRPDIYIDNNFLNNQVLAVYADDNPASAIYYYQSYTTQFVMDDYSFVGNAFTVYVPSAFFASLGTFADQTIRSIVDQYVIAGITYNIETY